MARYDYIMIKRPSEDDGLFYGEPFTKWQAWIDLIFLAKTEDEEIVIRGAMVKVQKGSVYMPLSSLAERWGWDRRTVKKFIETLVICNKVYNKTSSGKHGISSCISILNYESYFENFSGSCTIKRTIKKKKSIQKVDDVQLNEQLDVQFKNDTNASISRGYKCQKEDDVQLNEQLDVQYKEEKEERKENKKENFPHTPIKEINKEKKEEKEEIFADNFLLTKKITALHGRAPMRTCTCEDETKFSLTPEVPKEKKPTKKKSEEEFTTTYKARLIFDKVYTEKNDEAFYWAPKEIKALTELLKKIKFSREHRNIPLPVDDDSLLKAFEEFINKIQTTWVLEHFTMTNINAQYQVIIQDIKNNRNGQTNYQTTAERNRINSERQKEAVRANIRKLEENRERWLKEHKREGTGVKKPLNTDDPFDFL